MVSVVLAGDFWVDSVVTVAVSVVVSVVIVVVSVVTWVPPSKFRQISIRLLLCFYLITKMQK